MSISSSECGDLGAALVAVRLLDLEELLLDEAVDALLVAEDRAQLGDALDQVGVLLADLVGLERGEAGQAEVEDRLRLDLRQLEVRHQLGARRLRIARRADDADDLVDVRQRDEQSLEDVRARLGLAQLVLRAPDDDLALVPDVRVDDPGQRQRARDAVDERDGVHAERRLQRRVLVELVQHDLGDHVALELDHEADARAVGLVAQVGDLADLPVLDDLGDLLDQTAAVAAPVTLRDLVGHLGDDDRLLALAQRLDVRAARGRRSGRGRSRRRP